MASDNSAFEDASIQFYSRNAAQYAEDTMTLDMGKIYPHFLCHIPQKGKILDAGCGSGRDSLYFLRHGYQITAFDASKEMCQEAARRLLQPVQQLRFEQLAYDSIFDGAWVSASLVHTPRDKQSRALHRLLCALKPEGVLYASWKYGNGYHAEGYRHFCDMDESRVKEVLKRLENASVLEQWISLGSKNTQQKWFNILLQRR